VSDSRDDRISQLEAELEVRDAENAEQKAEIEKLKAQVAELLERLNRNPSTNGVSRVAHGRGTREAWRSAERQLHRPMSDNYIAPSSG